MFDGRKAVRELGAVPAVRLVRYQSIVRQSGSAAGQGVAEMEMGRKAVAAVECAVVGQES